MLTIIHGNDLNASRNFLLSEKKRLNPSYSLSEGEVTLDALSQILDGGGLFNIPKAVFIEYFLSQRKKSREKDAISDYLVKASKSNSIFLWEGKELTSSSLSPFKNAIIKSFKLPTSLFNFLDALRPDNRNQLIKLHQQTLQTTSSEMIFFMLIRQIRLLLALYDNEGEVISETARLSTWQKSKLQKQSHLFNRDQLTNLYDKLFHIEKAQKTGNLSSDLVAEIDFFLLSL